MLSGHLGVTWTLIHSTCIKTDWHIAFCIKMMPPWLPCNSQKANKTVQMRVVYVFINHQSHKLHLSLPTPHLCCLHRHNMCMCLPCWYLVYSLWTQVTYIQSFPPSESQLSGVTDAATDIFTEKEKATLGFISCYHSKQWTGYLRDEQRSASSEKQASLTQSIKVFNYIKLGAHFLFLQDYPARAFC